MIINYHKYKKMTLRMPKKWVVPAKFSLPNPSINLESCIKGRQDWKYLDKSLVDQLFDEIDDMLISNDNCDDDNHQVVTYNNDDYWIVVHPSATKTIELLDNKFRIGIFKIRDIATVPINMVNVPEYWTS